MAAHPGRTIKDAPTPNPPYVCRDTRNDPPPTITAPSSEAPKTTKPVDSKEPETSADNGAGPNLNPSTKRSDPASDVTPGQSPITPDRTPDRTSPSSSIVPFAQLLRTGQSLEQLRAEAVALVDRVMAQPDPIAAFKSLIFRDQQLVLNATTPGEVESSVHKNVSSSCMTDGAVYRSRSMAGNTLFTWWQSVEKCGTSGIDVPARIIDSGGETSTPTWSHEGKANADFRYKSPGLGTTTTMITSEKFKQEVVFEGAGAGAKTVCIRGTVDKWGNYLSDNGCHL